MPANHNVNILRQSAPAVLPSLLQCDFGNLAGELERLERAGVKGLHLDVMDGHFVPNFTYGMPIVKAVRELTDLPLDVHLMMSNPQDYLEAFRDAGADLLTIHAEATDDPIAILRRIRQLGMGAGIALNPDTDLAEIKPCLEACDLVLVMSVQAGFGGQQFNAVALDKLEKLRNIVADDVMLEVDGGVNRVTIEACAHAGANYFVVGSAIFGEHDYTSVVKDLTELATV